MLSFKKLLFSLVGLGADIVTVTTGTANNLGNVVADLQTYFAAKLLEVAELVTILDQWVANQAGYKFSLNTMETL